MNKYFLIKVYDSTGATLIKTIKSTEILNEPSFKSVINGGFGECKINLNLPIDDFGEGTEIDYMTIVKIYEYDVTNHPTGILIYTGFVAGYKLYISGSVAGVELIVHGLASLLEFIYYKSGSSYAPVHTGVDPAVILKAIIDYFNTVYPSGLIGYTALTIDTVGTNVSITYDKNKCYEACKKVKDVCGGAWYWKVDRDGQVYLKQKPATATHTFTIGKDIEALNIDKSSEDIKNFIRVEYTGGANKEDSNAASITDYGRRDLIVTDTTLQDLATATQRVNKELTDNKDAKIKGTLTVNTKYDLESVKVGDTCKILNYKTGSILFDTNMQIVSISYSLSNVKLELAEISSSFGQAVNDSIS